MVSNEQIESLRPRISQFRIVLGALIGGVAIPGVIVMMVTEQKFQENLSTLSLIFFGLSLVVIVQAFVIPGFVRSGGIRQIGSGPLPDEEDKDPSSQDQSVSRLLGVWFTSTLISAAMLESAVFLNLAGAFVEKNAWHLVAAGVILLLMLTRFPTEDRIIGWIEEQIRDRQRAS